MRVTIILLYFSRRSRVWLVRRESRLSLSRCVLYYATLDKRFPVKDRLMVISALGYFILPVDLIPDALPGGFADDTAALIFVLKQVWSNLTEETKSKAKDRLRDWFGNVSDDELYIPGLD